MSFPGLSGPFTPPTFAYISLLSQEVKAKLFHRHFFRDTESHCCDHTSIHNMEFRNESVADIMSNWEDEVSPLSVTNERRKIKS